MDFVGLKRWIFGAADVCHANLLARKLHRGSLAVLCYHGVVERYRNALPVLHRNTVSVTEFESQIDYLVRFFTPVSGQHVVDSVEEEKLLPPNPVLITFDDGYRNNLTHAAPILRRKGVPAVFGVTTSYVGTRSILWADEILLRVLDWQHPALHAPTGLFRLPSAISERLLVARRISQGCKRIPIDTRNEFLAFLRSRTPPVPSYFDPEANEFMNWAEARQLADQGFDIGSHTVSHPILTGLTAEMVAAELRESRATIERHCRSSCTMLAYPNGSQEDYSSAILDEAERAGYRIAFSVEDRRAGRTPARFAIPRLLIPGHFPLPVFRAKVSGLYALLGRGR